MPIADLPTSALQTLVATGVFLLLLAVAGCLGVFYNATASGRYLLGFYAFFMILVMIMEFSASLALFTFAGRLDNSGVDKGQLNVSSGGGLFTLPSPPYSAHCRVP